MQLGASETAALELVRWLEKWSAQGEAQVGYNDAGDGYFYVDIVEGEDILTTAFAGYWVKVAQDGEVTVSEGLHDGR